MSAIDVAFRICSHAPTTSVKVSTTPRAMAACAVSLSRVIGVDEAPRAGSSACFEALFRPISSRGRDDSIMTCLTLPIGLLVALAAGVLVVALAPAEASFLGAVVIAAAWCRWLDAHGQTVPENALDPPVPQQLFRTSLAATEARAAIVE